MAAEIIDEKLMIAECNAELRKHKEFDWLTPEEAKAVLTDVVATSRMTMDAGKWYECVRTSIKFKGRWLRLCRTDLKDDVRTYVVLEDEEDPVSYYRERIQYGARVSKTSFAVVDSFSDG